ncbi:glomulin [Plutella xylostella]|uniref:glomulin n=1 Tax=Plutella xylostella TaxID=51655 RepID=UPI002032E5C1|nr:glomulin [Plutella xylostella]
MEDSCTDVVSTISVLLESGKYREALSIPTDNKFMQSFKDNCTDLISEVISKIQDDTAVTKPSLQSACEELLSIIIQRATPEEALLELIEQVEVSKNDAQFSIILNPLQQVLKKLTIKRGRSLEWCLNSISTYIESIPIPEHQLEGKERLLMDCDPNVRRITKVYSQLPQFYHPFIKEITGPEANVRAKQIIVAFLISLLGKPLIYIDLDPEENATSELRQCCAIMVQDICKIEKDILKFLIYLELCSKKKQKQARNSNYDSEEEPTPYQQHEKLNMTTLSGLFYTVFSGHFNIPDSALPQVYSNEYIIHTGLLSAVHFFSFTEFGPLSKALSLSKALISYFPDNVSYSLLSSSVHFDLYKGLINVAIYSTFESIRKQAVSVITLHVNKFDYKGRCMLIKYLLDTSNHSGMMGYAITLYKDSVNEAFKNPQEFPDCFSGAQLKNMIKKMCHLPHGAESDLMELGDQIISCLNFLRYLALKDINNVTGIRDCFGFLESEYLAKLRIGLNMSKAHYEVKLRDIEEGKDQPEELAKVSINIAGNMLDNIPADKKKEIIQSALNGFHMMEGLVARLTECINVNKMQGLTMECE